MDHVDELAALDGETRRQIIRYALDVAAVYETTYDLRKALDNHDAPTEVAFVTKHAALIQYVANTVVNTLDDYYKE